MKPIIAANWKMHKTRAEALEFCRMLRNAEVDFDGVEVLICPPFTALFPVSTALEGSSIKLGAQNMHWEEKGAYTGEIAAPMLSDLGAEYVIIGHSERRHLLGEGEDLVRRKVRAALDHGLKPILCVGETELEREQGNTEEVISRQLSSALTGVEQGKAGSLVVAYEPVWAIGTGRAASPADADCAAQLIFRLVRSLLGDEAANEVRVQYGGSVKPENIGSFVGLSSIGGALVGGASLDVFAFRALLCAAREAVAS